VPGKATSFDPKEALRLPHLSLLDDFVACRLFYVADWVQKNRSWPPQLHWQEGVKLFVRV
jgi:hypothetical protein